MSGPLEDLNGEAVEKDVALAHKVLYKMGKVGRLGSVVVGVIAAGVPMASQHDLWHRSGSWRIIQRAHLLPRCRRAKQLQPTVAMWRRLAAGVCCAWLGADGRQR